MSIKGKLLILAGILTGAISVAVLGSSQTLIAGGHN
jgi:hypothetical protein